MNWFDFIRTGLAINRVAIDELFGSPQEWQRQQMEMAEFEAGEKRRAEESFRKWLKPSVTYPDPVIIDVPYTDVRE